MNSEKVFFGCGRGVGGEDPQGISYQYFGKPGKNLQEIENKDPSIIRDENQGIRDEYHRRIGDKDFNEIENEHSRRARDQYYQ
jgi:hypothetical protein